MRIAVTGSIAEDYLMSFEGAFSELILPDEIHRLSLSFLVDDLDVRPGGVAANICFGMGQLGMSPLLVGAAGRDFRASYQGWLADHGVDTSGVHISAERHTARFLCTTDGEQNQIASFYTGAMVEARDVDLCAVIEAAGGADLVVVSPNDPDAMLRHHQQALGAGLQVVADPSQQLARLDPDQTRVLVDGATYLMCNEYEAALIDQQTGWSREEVLERVEVRVTTCGSRGSRIECRGHEDVHVPAVASDEAVEPTGVGDAFRAGLLAGRGHGLDLERSAQLGSLVATHVLETHGPQSYTLDPEVALHRFARAYGDDAARDVDAVLARAGECGVPSSAVV